MQEQLENAKKIVCKYLAYSYRRKDGSRRVIRLPLVHVRLISQKVATESVALVDSGATSTLIPLELAEILELEYEERKAETIGAGGSFQSLNTKLQTLTLLKNVSAFAIFRDFPILVPEREGILPYMVLGRDIFKRFNITFHEKREKITFTRA